MEVLFAQETSIERVLLERIAGSNSSIHLALYRLTNLRLARALVEAYRRGLDVRVVLDAGKYEANPALEQLFTEHGVPHRPFAGRQGPPTKMHHKFAIFDEKLVTTGSYNWTEESEEQNFDELILLREEAVVARYRKAFEQLWAQASRASAADESLRSTL